MKNLKVWINKKFVNTEDAKISVFDRGFLYGDGVFETMRSYAGIVFNIDAHIDRLFLALETVRIKPPYTKKNLRDAVYECLAINDLKDANIRLALTRGEGVFGIGQGEESTPNVVITSKELREYPEWMYAKGISAKVVDIRQNEFSPLSKIKSMNFLNYILARVSANDKGFNEAILMNTNNYVTEAATSNIFLVKRSVVITPSIDTGILPGITRGVIIKMAKKIGINIKEKQVLYMDLLDADEVFLTNSLVEVLAVTKIDSDKVGRGSPGETTKLLHTAYQQEVIKSVLGKS